VKVVFSLEPSPVMTGMIATPIPMVIKPCSIAVAGALVFQEREKLRTGHLFLKFR